MVDLEVRRWIQKELSEDEKQPSQPPRAVNPKKKLPKGMHPFSRGFIALTKRLRLRPIGAQVVVRCERCNIATMVDGVFLNARGRVVLVELKCGFEGYVDRSTGNMRGVFASFSDAPKNQHQIQLAFTRCMFERTFPELGTVDGIVVRMTETGAHVRSVDPDVDRVARRVFAVGRYV